MNPDFTKNTPGRCACGCWQKTSFNKHSDAYAGYEAGTYMKYVTGHQTRQSGSMFEYVNAGYKTPCWIWNLGLNRGGYAVIYSNGKSNSGHKHFYELVNGPVPDGLHLDHLCRNRACVRPDHLDTVTPNVNVLRGSNTRITESQIQEMKALYAAGKRKREIARLFGLGEAHTGAILNGKKRVSCV